MTDYLEFMKQLFFVMLYLTGIIACFFLMVGFIENMIDRNKKENKKVITVDGTKYLDEETKKELNKIAEKIANEMLSDDYKKED